MSNASDPTGQGRYPAMFAGYDDGSRVNDPEDRMPKYYPGQVHQKSTNLKTQLKKDAQKVADTVERGAKKVGQKVGDVVQGAQKGAKRIGQKVGDAAHQIGQKAANVGRKIQGKVEQVIDEVKHSRFPWLHIVVAGVVVLVAVKILRTETTVTK